MHDSSIPFHNLVNLLWPFGSLFIWKRSSHIMSVCLYPPHWAHGPSCSPEPDSSRVLTFNPQKCSFALLRLHSCWCTSRCAHVFVHLCVHGKPPHVTAVAISKAHTKIQHAFKILQQKIHKRSFSTPTKMYNQMSRNLVTMVPSHHFK